MNKKKEGKQSVHSPHNNNDKKQQANLEFLIYIYIYIKKESKRERYLKKKIKNKEVI